jgi:ABC-type lipoprotein release transport system permease subunit
MCSILEENVFISYDGKQGVATAKGVDAVYEDESPLKDHLTEGKFTLHKGDIPLASTGAGLAYKMGISPRFVSPIELYFPARTRNISISNPVASIEGIKVYAGSTFSISSEIDNSCIILPIEKMRELLEYKDEVSGVEIRLSDPSDKKAFKMIRTGIEERLPENLQVLDRYQQNESLYKMMKYEKASIYMILIFVIIIIAFNIFGSLSMLIIEKKEDISTLKSLGARESLIKDIFILEGWMISLAGLAVGLVFGIGFSLIQQHFGIIKMPGNFVVQAYPVILSVKDIIFTSAAVAAIGYIIALLPVHRVRT